MPSSYSTTSAEVTASASRRTAELINEIELKEQTLRTLKKSKTEIELKISGLVQELNDLKEEVEVQMETQGHSEIVSERFSPIENSSDAGGGVTNIDYESEYFPSWSDALEETLLKTFKFSSFRKLQKGACNAIMDGRDLVVRGRTGGGKTLIYQLPALIQPGYTVVFVPTKSLMSDLKMRLEKIAVGSINITAGSGYETVRELLRGPTGSKKLVHITPEKFEKSPEFIDTFKTLALQKKIARFVIEEAHVPPDQHTFRLDYVPCLRRLRLDFPNVPITAISATFPSDVLQDLVGYLSLPNLSPIHDYQPGTTAFASGPLTRENLYYEVAEKPVGKKRMEYIADWIKKRHPKASGIVYCGFRKDTKSISAFLCQSGIKSDHYNGGMTDSDRDAIHKSWREGRIQVVVATNSFGVGIDNSMVEFVIHDIMPSVHNYYQESSRAGRKGQPAECLLLYHPGDFAAIACLAVPAGLSDPTESSRVLKQIRDMAAFAQNINDCRIELFERYLSIGGAQPYQCENCDNCQRKRKFDVVDVDVAAEAWAMVQKVLRHFNPNLGTGVSMGELAKGSRDLYLNGADRKVLIIELLLRDIVRAVVHESPAKFGTRPRKFLHFVPGASESLNDFKSYRNIPQLVNQGGKAFMSFIKPRIKKSAIKPQLKRKAEPSPFDADEEFDVEKIEAQKYDFEKRRTVYLVKWLGYGPEVSTWEEYKDIQDVEQLSIWRRQKRRKIVD